MNKYIYVSAWIMFILLCIDVIWLPFKMGQNKGDYDGADWIAKIILLCLIIPILGRILGWW